MLRTLIARIAIGGVAICTFGGIAGIGLANYAESGTFHFYKQPRMSDWPEQTAARATPDALALADIAGDPRNVPFAHGER